MPPEWYGRYSRLIEEYRLPKGPTAQQASAVLAGLERVQPNRMVVAGDFANRDPQSRTVCGVCSGRYVTEYTPDAVDKEAKKWHNEAVLEC